MGLFRGIGARKDSIRGTIPIETRKVLAGLFASTGGISARPGLLPGGSNPLLTGDVTWAYNVGLFHVFTSRGAADGGQLYGNDGSVLIGATGVGSTVPIAPGAGLQRIDIAWTRHPSATENADTTSDPLFGVASGVAAAANPVAPTALLPVGATELGRNLMTSAATSTLSAGNTITQATQFTALRGTPISVGSQAERDALVLYDGLQVWRRDLLTVETYNGTAWGNGSVAGSTQRPNTSGPFVTVDGIVLAPSITGDGVKRFKITAAFYSLQGTVAGDVFEVILKDSSLGSTLGKIRVIIPATPFLTDGQNIMVSDVPAAGAHIYGLSCNRIVGTGQVSVLGGAGFPIEIIVEQIT